MKGFGKTGLRNFQNDRKVLRGRHAAKQRQQGDQHEIEGDQGSGWEAGSRVASGQKWLMGFSMGKFIVYNWIQLPCLIIRWFLLDVIFIDLRSGFSKGHQRTQNLHGICHHERTHGTIRHTPWIILAVPRSICHWRCSHFHSTHFEVPAARWKHQINIRHKNRVPKADE